MVLHLRRGLEQVGSPVVFLLNMLMVYVIYAICRVAFVFENWDILGKGLAELDGCDVLVGSLYFDTSAIAYMNIPYAMMMLLPLHYKESHVWQIVAKTVFVVVNGLAVIANLADCVYFRYTGRRTTATVMSEFSNENNLGAVFGAEVTGHWYLVLLGLLIIMALWKLYISVPKVSVGRKIPYYITHAILFLIYIPLSIIGMRGGATTAVRPITVSNANQFVNHPAEAAAILNTPFSIIRTFGKKAFTDPGYFTATELDSIYTPLHQPAADSPGRGKNVVVLIVESFGREYIGAYNKELDGGKYKGYAPFVDSLYRESMTFDYTFCNGRKSIDGMPGILSSIPMFVEPFFLTPASLNDVSGLAGELSKAGYGSAFFHGAQNGSMGFQAFARATGFQSYYGRTEYNEDPRFDGDKDFDGTWAIWDEPFLQFYALKMSEMEQPFVTAVFTASSHHPYEVPEEYKGIYKEEGNNPIHKCIRYTDHALERFFKTAGEQPWFGNTIFVLTSDHTNLSDHAEYQTDLGGFCSPILIYEPSHTVFPAGRRAGIAQHIDIMPTILSALGYDRPYVAFGKDLLSTPPEEMWAVNYYNGIYQYIKGDYLMQYDGMRPTALYNIRKDWMLTDNILSEETAVGAEMQEMLQAIIQSYMQRMNNNNLIFRDGGK